MIDEFKDNILPKKGITNLDFFLSFSLFYHKFQKITIKFFLKKTVLMAVADKATENFLLSLNGDNCFPHSSVDLSVLIFQEDSKCIGN